MESSTETESIRWRPLVAAIVVVAFVVGSHYVGVKGDGRSAFNRWRPIVAELMAGENIYAKHAFPTPPIMALVLWPFASLSNPLGMLAWFAFKTLAFAGAVFLLCRWMGPLPKSGARWVGVVALALSARMAIGDLEHGNVNLWILFLVVAALSAFRARWDVLAGVVLALAIACKLTPMLFAGYFAWKRAGRVLLGVALGLTFWWGVVPAGVLGWSNNATLLRDWSRQMIEPFVARGAVDAEQVNQSLPGLLARWLTASVAIKPDDGRPPISVNFTTLSPTEFQWALRSALAVVLVALLALTRGQLDDRFDDRWLHEFCLTLIAMLLLSERSWKHHYVAIIPSYFVLTATAWRLRVAGERWWSAGIALALALSALAMATTSKDALRPIFGPDAAKLAQAHGAYVWAALALGLTHAGCRRRSATLAPGVADARTINPSQTPRSLRLPTPTFPVDARTRFGV